MSSRPLLWKFLLILCVVAVAGFFSFPPQERIALGLDLRGGAHILMQVDTPGAVRYQLEQTQSRLGQALEEAKFVYESIVIPDTNDSLEIRGTDASRRSEVRAELDKQLGSWDISSLGSGGWRLVMPAEVRQYYETSAVDMTVTKVRERIDALGVTEPLVTKQGIAGDRVLIQLPGVEDPERVKEILGDPAVLEWKVVTYPARFGAERCGSSWRPTPGATREAVIADLGGALPPDTELYEERLGDVVTHWPLKSVSTVVGNDLRNAWRDENEWGDPVVAFELSPDAGRRFEAATRQNVGCIMAITLNKKVISAPTIQSTIRDRGNITGGFTIAEAEDLSLKLRSGSLPTQVSIIEERTIGPSLGRDSIRKGLTAGLAGFTAILLFMVVYYRGSGINATVALGLNVLLIFGALGALPFLFGGGSGFRATLTLPGIAGIILTVGMAVDSNVLIFERIRDELRLGKTVRSAIDQGFSKAFLTILDCNVTTIISAAFLAMYGTGPVRGFAVTLVIGLVCSMFTALFVSRQLFELILSRRKGPEALSI